MSRGPTARSSSSPSPPRRRACSARNITPRTRSSRLAKTAGVINTDGGSIYGPAKNFTISGNAKLGLLDMLIAEGKKQGRYYSPDPHPEAGHFYRSDHFSFAKVGVPAISFGDGNDLVNGGIKRGEALDAEYVDEALPPAERRMVADLGLQRHGRGRQPAPHASGATSPTRAHGPTGAPTASSARSATARRPSAAALHPLRRAPLSSRARESAVERNARACSSRSSGRAGRAADARDLRPEADRSRPPKAAPAECSPRC